MASFGSRSCGAELTQASEVVWGDLVSDPSLEGSDRRADFRPPGGLALVSEQASPKGSRR